MSGAFFNRVAIWQWLCRRPGQNGLPARDRLDASSGMFVVFEQWEVSAKLDDSRQFATALVNPPNGVSCSFIDGEHGRSLHDPVYT